MTGDAHFVGVPVVKEHPLKARLEGTPVAHSFWSNGVKLVGDFVLFPLSG